MVTINSSDIEVFTATPDTSLMTKIGKTGYSFPEYNAEFADNSVDERVEGEILEIDIQVKANSLIFKDNGGGMDKLGLVSAMTLAKSHKAGKLGEYGLGLKSAAVGLAEHFVIETTQAASGEVYATEWDESAWNKADTWSIPIQTLPKGSMTHGTVITLTKLRMKTGNKIGQLRVEMGRRFGPYIRRGQVIIRVNGEKAKAPELKLLEDEDLLVENPRHFTVRTKKGYDITGWVGILANGSQKGLYGFDTFRRGRMISFYDKIGFNAHPTVARLVGEINMDHVPVTNNKREWIKTDELYEDAVDAIKEALADHVRECRRISSTKDKHTAVERARLDKFKDALGEAMQYDDLRDFTRPERAGPDDGDNTPDPDGNSTANVPAERRDPGNSTGTSHPGPAKNQRVPKKINPNRRKNLTVRGRKFDYEYIWSAMGPEAPWMTHDWDEDKRILQIFGNEEHPSYHATKDPGMLAFMHIIESVSRLFIEQTGGDWNRYDEVRETLLRESSKRLAEIED